MAALAELHGLRGCSMTDATFDYNNIDEEIRPLIEYLRSNRMRTVSSCQGGEGHQYAVPTVFLGWGDEGIEQHINNVYRLMKAVCDDFEIIHMVGFKNGKAGYSYFKVELYSPFKNYIK